MLIIALSLALAGPDCPANCASLLEIQADCDANSVNDSMCDAVGYWHEDLCVEPTSSPCEQMCDELQDLANLCFASFSDEEPICGDVQTLADACRGQDVELETPTSTTEDSGVSSADSGTQAATTRAGDSGAPSPPPAAADASSWGCATLPWWGEAWMVWGRRR